MLERLIENGFTYATEAGRKRGKMVVRAYHPAHGWVYAKFADDDGAALDAVVARVKAPAASRRPQRVDGK